MKSSSSRRETDLTSEVAIADDAWHRIGLTWHGSHRVLYLGDIEVARDARASLQGSLGDCNIATGKDRDPGTFWSGLIDDVRVYDRVVVP